MEMKGKESGTKTSILMSRDLGTKKVSSSPILSKKMYFSSFRGGLKNFLFRTILCSLSVT